MLEFPCTLFRACPYGKTFLQSYISLIHAGNQIQYYISCLPSTWMTSCMPYTCSFRRSSTATISIFQSSVFSTYSRHALHTTRILSIPFSTVGHEEPLTRRGHSCASTRSNSKPPRKDFFLYPKQEASST
jgi:hypothetical protein